MGSSIHFAGPAEIMLFIEAMGNAGLGDQTCTRSIPPAKRRQRQPPGRSETSAKGRRGLRIGVKPDTIPVHIAANFRIAQSTAHNPCRSMFDYDA